MGGVVSSFYDSRNRSSLTEHEMTTWYRNYGPQAVPMKGTEQPGFSAIYRMPNVDDAEQLRISKEYYDTATAMQLMHDRCKAAANDPAVAWRPISQVEKRKVKTEDGKEKEFSYYHCAEQSRLTFGELWKTMENFSKGLVDIGIEQGEMVSIYEETRWEWLVTIYAIWLQKMVASTVYANLGQDALAYALNETCSKAIICNGAAVPNLVKLLKENNLTTILIYLDELPAGTDLMGFQAHAWKDVVKKGAARSDLKVFVDADKEEEALIMYTSGTTGNPKGVIHSHGSLISGIKALNHRLIDLMPEKEGEKEVYCAYLPLAHVLEFAVVNLFLHRGTMVGFGNPRTLTDAFAVPHGDLREFKPKVIIAVPRVFDTIRKAVESKLPKPGTLKRTVFDRAYASRLAALKEGKETPYYNEKVFAAAGKMLGGNIYGMLSGGGPLSASTQEFVNVVCAGPLILQGWGLTETVCCGGTQRLGDLDPSCVGQPIMSAEIRLMDTGEYKSTDKPEPRGELLEKGPFIFKGYYKQPELTKEAIDSEGWFHTGDVGAMTADGRIKLIGRVKALAKNVLGEYIALENLEAIFSQNPLSIVNGVCVVVHPEKAYIGALVLTDEGRAKAFATAHGIKGEWPDVISTPEFQAAAVKSFAETGTQAKLKSFEMLKQVRLLNDEWTAENGLMTPTTKLRRTNVDSHYKDVIADIFKN